MNRRELMLLGGVAVVAPHTLRAQQKAMPVIGVLNTGSPGPLAAPFMAAFLQGLSEAGYVEIAVVSLYFGDCTWLGSAERVKQFPGLSLELIEIGPVGQPASGD